LCWLPSFYHYASPGMTRLSGYFLPTEREAPADAEAGSHKPIPLAGVAQAVAELWQTVP
jgi:prolyl-tRNA synthetase